MDVLSDILGALRLRGTLYFSTEFGRPWGLRVPQFERVARFHLMVRGACWVRVMPDLPAILLEPGDLILIPHGAEHVLADTPDTPCRTVDEVVKAAGFTGEGALVHGGEDRGNPTRLVCGHFAFDDGFDHSFLAQLPPAIVVRWSEMVKDSPLENIFRFITREVLEGRPGHEAVTRRLSEVLFVQAVRSWTESSRHEQGILAALADPGLAAALAAMHKEPAKRWTLDELARRAAMGRSAFADRFKAVVGETPHRYLTLWRVQNARRLLAESDLSLDRIATEVGYDSSASLSRAFRRTVRTAPGTYRRSVRRNATPAP
ncbi:MAG: AraC family transcriptional regulator [Gemmatimonadales bacterium]|nr:AraC family transcriptional regulator [Gemmatimonadota bacterium]MCL4214934.1 AraC family transcriptional regulator [Gemmatimonadales bacterium]